MLVHSFGTFLFLLTVLSTVNNIKSVSHYKVVAMATRKKKQKSIKTASKLIKSNLFLRQRNVEMTCKSKIKKPLSHQAPVITSTGSELLRGNCWIVCSCAPYVVLANHCWHVTIGLGFLRPPLTLCRSEPSEARPRSSEAATGDGAEPRRLVHDSFPDRVRRRSCGRTVGTFFSLGAVT